MGNKSNMEKMVTLAYLKKYFQGKKVFVTEHTGFKGTWLIQILALLEAKVKGFALAPENNYDLYPQIDGNSLCESIIHDIRDNDKLQEEIFNFEPDFIFHLAAQPIVLEGYKNPLYTFEVNALGTANLLNALRYFNKKCVVVCITTDKVYENNDDNTFFSEQHKLGGYDPYSASKAAAEIIISSYRNSFFNNSDFSIHQKSIASVRAGNVIGGGDYAPNRIIPDIVKAIQFDKPILLRNPHATRPWQHVIEPLSAYLFLATKMMNEPLSFNTAYNIGPNENDVLAVEELTKVAIQTVGKGTIVKENNLKKPHEAATLMLDINKIKNEIGWEPVYNSKTAIEKTISWYFDEREPGIKCSELINDYFHNKIDDTNED